MSEIGQRITYLQCLRCTGLFREEVMTECYAHDDEEKFLADLCPQCIEGWEFYNAFVGGNE